MVTVTFTCEDTAGCLALAGGLNVVIQGTWVVVSVHWRSIGLVMLP